MWRRRATGIGEHSDGYLTYRLLCYSWHYAAHSSRFAPCLPSGRWALGIQDLASHYHATLLQAAELHHNSVPRGYPGNHPRLSGPRVTTGAQLPSGIGTPGRTFPPKGFVYGTRPVYITQDPGRAIFPLRDYRRGSSAGTFSLQQVVGAHWVFPNQCVLSMGCS